jgi:hypothetical protein
VTQCGEVVSNVELPPWAGSNPYFLIAQHRQILESDAVSAEMHRWIDLIFGHKQKGKEAIENYNVYYYLTYEDYSHCLENEPDEIYRKSCEAQIVHFGQIPPQLFEEPHPRRPAFTKPPAELLVKESIDLVNVISERPIGILRRGNEVVMLRRNEIQTLVGNKSPAIMTKCVDYNLERTFSKKLCVLKKESARSIFFGKYFLVYGYATHEFRIFRGSNGSLEFSDTLDSKIESALINQQESLLLLGCHSGLLHICEIEYEPQKVQVRLLQSLPFPHPVFHLSEHDGFFTVCFGCYVAIYKIERPLGFLSKEPQRPFVRFFRSFENSLPVRGAFLADSPLYCLLLYDNAHLKVYSVNGQLIRSAGWAVKGIQRMTDAELNSLFCVFEEGRLMLVSTPDLRCLSELEIGGAMQVFDRVVVYKNKLQFIDCQP